MLGVLFVGHHNGRVDEGELAPNYFSGDINKDGQVNLTDAILVLQVMAGVEPASTIHKQADVNGAGKIGLDEVIYILQEVCGLRAQ